MPNQIPNNPRPAIPINQRFEQTKLKAKLAVKAIQDLTTDRVSYFNAVARTSSELESACRDEGKQLNKRLSDRVALDDNLDLTTISVAIEVLHQKYVDKAARAVVLDIIVEMAMLAHDIATQHLIDLEE